MNRGMSLRVVIALAALVAALALSACGDSDDDGGGGDAKAPSGGSAQAADGKNANASDGASSADDGGAGDGSGNASSGDTEPINLKQVKLTPAELQNLQQQAPSSKPYTGFGFDRGSKKDKTTLMTMFRDMQRELYGGEFMAFCKRFGTGLYSLPSLESGNGQQRIKECAAIVSRVAKRVANGDLEWPARQVQWVRVYRDPGRAPYAGVTVSGGKGDIRVSFGFQGGRWRPDFGVPRDLQAFSAR